MPLNGVIDDHVLARYRRLLDAEEEAFDQLEHAYEEGDRDHFEADLVAWHQAIDRKMSYFDSLGLRPAPR